MYVCSYFVEVVQSASPARRTNMYNYDRHTYIIYINIYQLYLVIV